MSPGNVGCVSFDGFQALGGQRNEAFSDPDLHRVYGAFGGMLTMHQRLTVLGNRRVLVLR